MKIKQRKINEFEQSIKSPTDCFEINTKIECVSLQVEQRHSLFHLALIFVLAFLMKSQIKFDIECYNICYILTSPCCVHALKSHVKGP